MVEGNPKKIIPYGIALGSNLGDRLSHLRRAVAAVLDAEPCVHFVAAAPVFETEPVDCPEGSLSFYNTVIEVRAAIDPLTLLKHLRKIEEALGRPNIHSHHAPRTVDLDILYAGDVLLQLPELTLPHPRMTLRRFVMEPLACIRPELVLPGQTRDVQALAESLRNGEAPLPIILENWIINSCSSLDNKTAKG